jgi:hypothetical protein
MHGSSRSDFEKRRIQTRPNVLPIQSRLALAIHAHCENPSPFGIHCMLEAGRLREREQCETPMRVVHATNLEIIY